MKTMPKPASKESPAEKHGAPSPKRRPTPEERRAAILSAALDVFSQNGFAAAKLDDVAQKAGVAKGTLYLYFPDKEALFEALVTGLASPVLDRVEALAADPSLSPVAVLDRILEVFQQTILEENRGRLLRLVISEGPRFPKIAAFHHREVVSRGLRIVRLLGARGYERGELPSEAIARSPQLFFAPFMLAVVWKSLFDRFDPLDVQTLIEVHRMSILGLTSKESRK